MQYPGFLSTVLCLLELVPAADCTSAARNPPPPPSPPLGGGPDPRRGETRSYVFNVTQGSYAPDGVQGQALLVNGQFPGPTLTANVGDTFEITVHNNLNEGTSFHWHGLYQKGTQWYDGVPGIDLCPIAPGESFTYTFLADQPGTTWWHAHYDAQLADGLFGPMLINGSQYGMHYDLELPIITLGSHYHKTYHELVKETVSSPPVVPYIDNNLINGRGYFDCSTVPSGQACSPSQPLSNLSFEAGKAHLLRLVNVGAEGTQHFAIDGHQITVVANDFIPVQPYKVDYVTLGTGQRTDLIVQGLSDPKGAYFARSNISGVCDPTNKGDGLANVYYSQADRSKAPASASTHTGTLSCSNDPLSKTVPLHPMPPPPSPGVVQNVNITFAPNGSGIVQFSMNGSPYYTDYNEPVLLLAKNSTDFASRRNVLNMGSNSSVRAIVRNTTPFNHPMHLHGHNPWILAEGLGEWDGIVTNPRNPQRRDVHILQAATPTQDAYVVFEWVQDNPGVWPFHCHVAWHVAVGLWVNFLEQPQMLQQQPIPSDVEQNCRTWWDWTRHDVVDQIDAGD